MIHLKLLFAILVLSAPTSLKAQNNKTSVLVTDLLKISRITDVEMSQDGNYVIYKVNKIVPSLTESSYPLFNETGNSGSSGYTYKDHDYKYIQQTWLLNLNDRNELYPIDTSRSVSNTVFSPDGKQIAYTKNVNGTSQIFLYTISTKEFRQLTHFKYGASNPVWGPDGDCIAFTSSITLKRYLADNTLNNPNSDLGTQRPEITEKFFPKNIVPDPNGDLTSIRAFLNKNEEDGKVKVIENDSHIDGKVPSFDVRVSHVFVVDTSDGAAPKVLTSGLYNFSRISFLSKDQLVANINEVRMSNYGEIPNLPVGGASIAIIQIDRAGFKEIISGEKEAYSIAAVSPSGRYLAYFRSYPGTVNVTRLCIKDLNDNKSKDYQIPVDRMLGNVQFHSDNNTIYFVSQENGGLTLYKGNWRNRKYEKLTSEHEGITNYRVYGDKLLFAKTTVENPSELYTSDLNFHKVNRLTDLNTTWLSQRKLSIPEKFSFKNELGLEIEYWVVKPVDFDSNKKYPLLLEMHGGPASMWGTGDQSMWHEFQYFAGKGIGVVFGNPRGSNGYGEVFLRANKKDWSVGPAKDVISYLDRTIAQGWADTTKLLISGGSYAGYLTTWIIAHDNRFLAASSQRGVYDFKTFIGEGSVWHIIPRYYDGYPWSIKVGGLLENHSPINYVKDINTPLLIFIGEKDTRVGITQSDMLYRSLKLLKKRVEYVKHPNAGHEITRTGDNRQRIDQMLRTYEFFKRYLDKDL